MSDVSQQVVKKPQRRRRWLRWLIVCSVLLVIAWFARSALLGPIVARLIAHEMSIALGGAATINKASGGP
jgi:hypothetical protein